MFSYKEPEPLVVAEPEEKVEEGNVAEALVEAASVAGVRLTMVATPEVAEPVEVEEEDDDCRSVVTGVGKKRRLEDDGVEEVGTSVVVPTGPRLMAERVGGVRRGSGVPADLFVRRAYRFVDRSLVGVRNGIVGDTYQTRGNFARAPFVDRGGYQGRGYRPYR